MIAEALIDLVMTLWAPPERLMSRTWALFRRRGRPLRAVGIVLCTLIALGSIALLFAVLVAIVGGVVLLAESV